MRSFWSDPFLWIHAAGIAALPILLEFCWLGLAVGDPVLPVWLEFFLVAAVGVAPVLWMQWQRPFSIFSVLFLALKPAQLTLEQRKILSLFKTQSHQVVSVVVSLVLTIVLWQLYRSAPLIADRAFLPSDWRLLGLVVAALAFLGSNLFLQVPASVLRVLLTSESAFAAIAPYPLERIAADFTVPGIQVNRILPLAESEAIASSPAVDSMVTTASATTTPEAEVTNDKFLSPDSE